MVKKKAAIIDYKLGNLFSVNQACEFLGYDSVITSDWKEMLSADYVILPGVGAFGDAMKNLEKSDMIAPLKDYINSGRPFMGVCLGLQLLFEGSDEFGSYEGLGVIKGTVKKFNGVSKDGTVVKVPQIQWNRVNPSESSNWQNSPLKECPKGSFMYFVHSFYAVPSDEKDILSQTEYGGLTYCSSISKKNVFACQFHPEKSGMEGLSIYKNWFQSLIQ